jgi:hypothetical protein
VLLSAIKKGASDIHVEPYEKSFRIRFRIDGVLHEEMRPPLRMKSAITSRLKIMASLDIAERRLPQDGRIKLKIGRAKEMDFRVSFLPTLFGEKIVLRLLDKAALQLDMTRLGFEARPLEEFKHAEGSPIEASKPCGRRRTRWSRRRWVVTVGGVAQLVVVGDDERPELAPSGEDAVVSKSVLASWRDQGRKPPQKLDRRTTESSGAGRGRPPELVADVGIVLEREASRPGRGRARRGCRRRGGGLTTRTS